MNRLTHEQVLHELDSLAGWRLEPVPAPGGEASAAPSGVASIARTFRFSNYYEVMAFVNALAYVAHRTDHHPDLLVHFNRVEVRFSTHDAGGVTQLDIQGAHAAERLLSTEPRP